MFNVICMFKNFYDFGFSKIIMLYLYQEMLPIHRYENGKASVIRRVKISPIDSVILNTYKWFEHPKTHQIFATCDGKRTYLQNMIKEHTNGRWVHINGDKSDYRRGNLIEVSKSFRTVKNKENSSKTVGVCYVKSRDRWKATLSNKLLGYFKTEQEACHARLKSLLLSNPMINFIREGTDPNGPNEMHIPISYSEYGKPDAYFDLDDVEMYPMVTHSVLGSDTVKHKEFVAIPPPRMDV